jgi:hypothetical protein
MTSEWNIHLFIKEVKQNGPVEDCDAVMEKWRPGRAESGSDSALELRSWQRLAVQLAQYAISLQVSCV